MQGPGPYQHNPYPTDYHGNPYPQIPVPLPPQQQHQYQEAPVYPGGYTNGYAQPIPPYDPSTSVQGYPTYPPPVEPAPEVPVPNNSIKLRIPAMATRSGRHSVTSNTGSEYQDDEDDNEDAQGEPDMDDDEEPEDVIVSQSGRKIKQVIYKEDSNTEDDDDDEEQEVYRTRRASSSRATKIEDSEGDDGSFEYTQDGRPRRKAAQSSLRAVKTQIIEDDDDSEEVIAPTGRGSRSRPTRRSRDLTGFIASDDDVQGRRDLRPRNKKRLQKKTQPAEAFYQKPPKIPNDRKRRYAQRQQNEANDGDFEPSRSPSSVDMHDDEIIDIAEEGLTSSDDGGPGRKREYSLRQRRNDVNYVIPPLADPVLSGDPGPSKKKSYSRKRAPGEPGWNATGDQLSRWMNLPATNVDSSEDEYTRSPRKGLNGGVGGMLGAGGLNSAGGLIGGGDLFSSGNPSNLGKVGDTALADADPLGVNTNVTFDEVGGLDDHIHSLKEMTLLPLLYPEVFQRFDVIPPRGVLFHGPPGTGKTLLARALAASARSDGRKISFFMRKGADCLSKWVGEAERQLRLLFEEARAQQPSIIFFDEIDGLAPVRSSKQDQIHASIVSTLLALMDGMDGRGQVVVIGATNRPDAVDPALRRPGRFDREFYFGLPTLAAREKILGIMTKKWENWTGPEGEKNVQGLAKLTKGYGGADLRALCTEAALNAIQRRYPQIYQSSDRLLLKPETIEVGLRDFMISIKKLVPSSARSSASPAVPLPPQLAPLLSSTFDKVVAAVTKVLPVTKKLTALEEAEFEEDSEEGALAREMTSQAIETLRVYRPRIVIHGPEGMGQSYLGAAVLHHFESFHSQSLELGALLSDSTRTLEAAIVQLFTEAKRHQPSIIYIPSLIAWCAAVPEQARTTVRAMLDTLAPTDPILLLAIIDGEFSSVPRDVRSWFGLSRENRIRVEPLTAVSRRAFFASLKEDIIRPPNKFADGVVRRKRVLEKLPIAPPLEPRKPTEAEMAALEDSDKRTIIIFKFRLTPVITNLRKKYKRFTKSAAEEHVQDMDIFINMPRAPLPPPPAEPEPVEPPVEAPVETEPAPVVEVDVTIAPAPLTDEPILVDTELPVVPPIVEAPIFNTPPVLEDVDLERIGLDVNKGKYLSPEEFLNDIRKIRHNASYFPWNTERVQRAGQLVTDTEMAMLEIMDAQFKLELERTAPRERKRRADWRAQKEKEKAEKAQAAAEADSANDLRRSGRTAGKSVDLTIMDPSLLERRLKRQRSIGLGDANASEDDPGRENKRSRTDSINGDDHDATRDSPSPPSKQNHVHFDEPHTNGVSNGAVFPLKTSAALSLDHLLNKEAQPEPSKNGVDEPMQGVEDDTPVRSPSPLPDFYINETLLSRFMDDLELHTSQLNIENLEQLRAECLSAVWRHRTEWNRDALLRELSEIAQDFIRAADENELLD